jgi:hypothetical protein
MNGIYFKELKLKGFKKEDASIKFDMGVNIISGASNTGKTFIFECLEYMLGGSNLNRRIKESIDYNEIYLEIGRYGGKPFVIKSDFEGGDFHIYECKIEDITTTSTYTVLKRKHSKGKKNTLSYHLLKECGLAGNRVRTNALGKTRELSFRDLRILNLIDEIRILTQDSPLLSGQYVNETAEKNVVKLLLSGNDDSGIIESVPEKVLANKAGRLEALHELIGIEKIYVKDAGTKNEVIDQEKKLEATLLELKEERDNFLNEFTENSKEIEPLIIKQRGVGVRKQELIKLLDNSSILEKQYISDIKRLNSTIEVGAVLETISDPNCPVCENEILNAPIDTLKNISLSSKAELIKLEGLQSELEKAKVLFENKISDLTLVESEVSEAINTLQNQIDLNIKSAIDRLSKRIDEINAKDKKIVLILNSYEKLEFLDAQVEIIQKDIDDAPPKKRKFEKVTTSMMTDLCKEVQALLISWGYPNVDQVSFSEDKQDFIIAGEDRNLAGKGYRAISFAASILAMSKLSQNKRVGLCLIDSPLVTYKKPDVMQGDAITEDMAEQFYRSLAKFDNESQVIIIENEDVPEDIISLFNFIHFTKNESHGRYGFIPKG